jgi:hypothetical protein
MGGEGRGGGGPVAWLFVHLAVSRTVTLQWAYTEAEANLETTAGEGASVRITSTELTHLSKYRYISKQPVLIHHSSCHTSQPPANV